MIRLLYIQILSFQIFFYSLENALSFYTALTLKGNFSIDFGGQIYPVLVKEIEPYDKACPGGSIIDTNLMVDICVQRTQRKIIKVKLGDGIKGFVKLN